MGDLCFRDTARMVTSIRSGGRKRNRALWGTEEGVGLFSPYREDFPSFLRTVSCSLD